MLTACFFNADDLTFVLTSFCLNGISYLHLVLLAFSPAILGAVCSHISGISLILEAFLNENLPWTNAKRKK